MLIRVLLYLSASIYSLMPLSVASGNLREKGGKVDYRIELKLAQRGLLLGAVLVMLCSVRRKATRQSTETGCPGRLWSLLLWRHPNPLPRLGHPPAGYTGMCPNGVPLEPSK